LSPGEHPDQSSRACDRHVHRIDHGVEHVAVTLVVVSAQVSATPASLMFARALGGAAPAAQSERPTTRKYG
jgi:hypothetical protein